MSSPRPTVGVDTLAPVVAGFDTPGTYQRATPIETGHINTTFRVETGSGSTIASYVLQRINTDIFRDPAALMQNIDNVTRHIRDKLVAGHARELGRRVLSVVPTREGQLLYRDADGGTWRMYVYIAGSHPLSDNPSLAEISEAGRGFGQFLADLTDLPPTAVTESIPHFHHGPRRLAAFEAAVAGDAVGRAKAVEAEVNFIRQHASLLNEPQQWLDAGKLPLRITHNDTKSNNILLDDLSGQALCVVDLDLVMPGLALYDLGDLVRTSVTGTAEDEPDLARIVVDGERLAAAAEGFMAGAGHLLSSSERESLPLGPPFMALIMATRFLTDYLAGDVYYRIHHPGHNLQRARAQIALTAELLRWRSRLAEIIARSGTGGT